MRIILIIAFVYVLFRTISRYVLPYVAQLWLKKAQKNFYQNNPNVRDANKRRQGDVNIRYDQKVETKTDEVGEYIDYEEVD